MKAPRHLLQPRARCFVAYGLYSYIINEKCMKASQDMNEFLIAVHIIQAHLSNAESHENLLWL